MGIPLLALQVGRGVTPQEDVTTALGRGVSLQNLLQARDIQAFNFQEAQRQAAQQRRDQEAFRKAFQDTFAETGQPAATAPTRTTYQAVPSEPGPNRGGTADITTEYPATAPAKTSTDILGDVSKRALKYGASPQSVLALESSIVKRRTELAQLDEATLKAQTAQHDAMRGSIESVLAAPAGDRPQLWRAAVRQFKAQGAIPANYSEEYPGDAQAKFLSGSLALGNQIHKEALDERTVSASEWKSDGYGGFVNIRTGEKRGGGAAPLPMPPDLARAAGIPEMAGQPVSPKYIEEIRRAMESGNTFQNFGGYLWLVDKAGNRIKQMGVSTPISTINVLGGPLAAANIPQAAVPPGAPAGTAPVAPTGEDVLKNLPPEVRTIVKGVANYDIDPDSLPLYRAPQAKMKLLALAKMYNPSYDQTQYGTKVALRKNFTSGDYSKQITAFNTAVHHLNMLDEAVDALENRDTQVLNRIGNAYAIQIGKDPQTNFLSIKNAVAGELSKVFKGGMATDAEIQAANNTLSLAQSPTQLHGAVRTYVGLMDGRLKALEGVYQMGMQAPADFRITTPESEAIFNRLSRAGQGAGVTGRTVRMRAPNGQERDVPANQVEHYKSRGAVVVR